MNRAVYSVKKDRRGEPRTTCYGGIEWEIFIESYDIPNGYNPIRFSQISQSEEFIQKMCDFVDVPDGIMIMRGPPGTGKTFASIAMCEKFTRMNSECAYFTTYGLQELWRDSFHDFDRRHAMKQVLSNSHLLVIDDLGASEITPTFTAFLKSVIDHRMNCENRGTVITTNLTDSQILQLFGNAFCDRLFTAQFLEFSGNSRRKKTI